MSNTRPEVLDLNPALDNELSGADLLVCYESARGKQYRMTLDQLRGAAARLGRVHAVTDPKYGADPTGATDSSAAIQAAIDTGESVFFPAGTYKANNLTQATNGQVLYGPGGLVQLVKNADGPILTCDGHDVQAIGLQFRGDDASPVFTGDNVVFTGDRCALVNCSSMWAYGRAVKATGDAFQIIGRNGVFHTADATATGYDVELGVSGTATLYHDLSGVYTSQTTGGILMTDVGGVTLTGGQIGKLTIAAGTSPAGVGGNKAIGARITGAILVEISDTGFDGCAIAGPSVTFSAGTSGCRLPVSNMIASGTTVTNLGNANNHIAREISLGSTAQVLYGDDGSVAVMTVDPTDGTFEFPRLRVPNNKTRILEAADGTPGYTEYVSTGDFVFRTIDKVGKGAVNTIPGSAGFEAWDINGTRRMAVSDKGFHPGELTGPFWVTGTGTPEGAVTAPVGSLYSRTDGGASTTLYVKESGTGNTGWVAK